MKKVFLSLLVFILCNAIKAQKVQDLFTSGDTKISWLGIDFSKAKMIGDFSEFADAGEKSTSEIRNKYFPSWNNLVVKEQKKFDLAGMLRKDNIFYDIDMVTGLNAKASLEDMEANNSPDYSSDDIKKFVSNYKLSGKSGIGIAFIVESFNKSAVNAVIHFVAINMSNKQVLIHEEITAKPVGIGMRNYWGGAIYSVITQIEKTYYKDWKSKYKN